MLNVSVALHSSCSTDPANKQKFVSCISSSHLLRRLRLAWGGCEKKDARSKEKQRRRIKRRFDENTSEERARPQRCVWHYLAWRLSRFFFAQFSTAHMLDSLALLRTSRTLSARLCASIKSVLLEVSTVPKFQQYHTHNRERERERERERATRARRAHRSGWKRRASSCGCCGRSFKLLLIIL